MRRRDFIALLGGATAWPLIAHAQQPDRVRGVGMVMGLGKSESLDWVRVLQSSLKTLGWSAGQNIQFTYRYASGDPALARKFAKELVQMQPDLIVAHTTPAAAALSQATRTVPVVLVSITDPDRDGFVAGLARPGGNMTGFVNYEFSMGAKWPEILKEVAPSTARVSLMLNPDTGSYYVEYLRSVDAYARANSVQATLAPVHSSKEIESTIVALGRNGNGGLIVLPSAPVTEQLQLIFGLVAQYRVPAVYPFGRNAKDGGLVGYGVELNDLFRRAAGYVDRILKGENPGDLPVQAPTKYELVIDLKTAKALGLTIPLALQASADEVIE